MKRQRIKNFPLFPLGMCVLVIGIVFILLWWRDVVIVFRGAMGILLALVGMFILSMVQKR